jgi:hypothetical protein
LEYFLQSHSFIVLRARNNFIGVIFQSLLNESKQMLLIHARGRVNVSINLQRKGGDERRGRRRRRGGEGERRRREKNKLIKDIVRPV